VSSATQAARDTLADICQLAQRLLPPPDTTPLDVLPPNAGALAANVGSIMGADLDMPRLGYGSYFQQEPLFPVANSMEICSADALNVAFQLTCSSLSLGFSHGNSPALHNLHAGNWFRGAAVVLAATLRGALLSEDVRHQGSFPASEHDTFHVHDTIPYPASWLHLIGELASQLSNEIMA
jgi:hypothetical protein